jgi:site-specific recombinase XerD
LPNLRLHPLRDTHATLLLAAGADVKTVSANAVARRVGLD